MEIINPIMLGGGVAIGLFFFILLALRAGRLLGVRALERFGEKGIAGVGSLETAVFALLGLLIAFTFSGALTRFDARRIQAVEEANAIGTAWFRVDLLPVSEQPKVRDAFRKYVDARIATYKALPDIAAAQKEAEHADELQWEIWRLSIAASRMPGSPPNTELLVIPALNEMFNFTTIRLTATKLHPPLVIYVMLVGLAVAAALLAGYQTAGEKGYTWMQKVGFAAIIAMTVYVILDIEYPRLGFVRIDAIDELLVNARAVMK